METAEFLAEFATQPIKQHLFGYDGSARVATSAEDITTTLNKHSDAAYLAQDAAEIMARKNWAATGALFKEDRSRAIDLIGVASQLIFNTFLNGHLAELESNSDNLDLIYGVADAHNRAMLNFCSVDERLLPTAYVPLADFNRSKVMAQDCIKQGFSGLLVPSACPKNHSPSHTGLFDIWAMAEEARLPILFHVGGGGKLLDDNYFNNGLPVPPDFHGGAENFRSVDYMAIPTPVMQTLATLILDGVMEKYPRLMFGVIEQGAGWLPSWMRYLDSAYNAFARHEERLQKLSMRPSEYVTRQIKATPYPTEDVGWIVEQAGSDVALFSTDYPHVEGGRNPVKRFDQSLQAQSASVHDSFYRDNFCALMGAGLPAALSAAH
jgi:predicted TIM-barrel fold metal-dependent hydrolase